MAAGSSPECTDGNVVWQPRTHGCAEVTAGNGYALCCKTRLSPVQCTVYKSMQLFLWMGRRRGHKSGGPEGDECRAVLVIQDTRFTGGTQTTTPLKFLHEQFLSPSAKLLVFYIY